jgi:hypothetical protein
LFARGIAVEPNDWFLLDDRRTASPRPFSDHHHHPYIVLDAHGPAVTALPRTTSPPRPDEQDYVLGHAAHACPPPCRLNKNGFILRWRFSFHRDAFSDGYSCTELDERVLIWIQGHEPRGAAKRI